MNVEDIKYLNYWYNKYQGNPDKYIKHYRYVVSGIPLAYRDYNFDMFTDPKISPIIKKLKKYYSIIKDKSISGLQGKGLYFFGNRGSGKTSLMCILLKEIINLGNYTCKFITFQDLVNLLHYKDSFENSVENPMASEEEVAFLAIDGFGEDSVQEYNKGKFINLLKKRYFQLKPTFITSVLSPLSLSSEEKFGNSIGSLVHEIMNFIDHSRLSDFRKK